jgi:GABA(A) receptor-associated protein
MIKKHQKKNIKEFCKLKNFILFKNKIFINKNMAANLKNEISESNRILSKFPDRIPIIVNYKDDKMTNMLKKNKFLVPTDISASSLLIHIRNNMKKQDSTKALFLFCDNKLVSGTECINKIYEEYKIKNNLNTSNSNKFLYITLAGESTFGK